MIYAVIQNESGTAQIYLHGAHITSFIPNGQEQALFLSLQSEFMQGKAIRGGIPISWPWFADHPNDSSKPAHGFARTSLWDVRSTKSISESETEIVLGLVDSESTRTIWNFGFDLKLSVIAGRELSAQLTMTNTDEVDFTVTSAFHSYYMIGNIDNVAIDGLEDTEYIDKVDNFIQKTQVGTMKISSETDRIYLDTTNDCIIDDSELHRTIHIHKNGSNSTVVWNPWSEKALKMKDLGDLDYKKFVCVEVTNAGTNTVRIAPGKQHELGMKLSVEALQVPNSRE